LYEVVIGDKVGIGFGLNGVLFIVFPIPINPLLVPPFTFILLAIGWIGETGDIGDTPYIRLLFKPVEVEIARPLEVGNMKFVFAGIIGVAGFDILDVEKISLNKSILTEFEDWLGALVIGVEVIGVDVVLGPSPKISSKSNNDV
jgi:hypothetical protein